VPITVESLPEGYSGPIQVGDESFVTDFFSAFFMKFANGLQVVEGAVFSYSIKRFNTIEENAVILDPNLKIMMKPNGLINTEVHDGTPYMQMTAEENRAVPEEKILVTAVSGNRFARQAESLTFLGDLLEYDFTDVNIRNEDGVIIGKRNGMIKRRISANGLIDIDKDWRVQRYRRYRMSDEDWTNFILQNDINSSLYNVGGNNAFTLANINTTQEHRFILTGVENYDFYQDFTNKGAVPNLFLDGITNGSSIIYGQRMETVADNVYKLDAIAPLVNNGKDLFIFPLDEMANPDSQVERFQVKRLSNTVVRNNNGQFSNSQRISFNIQEDLSQSSFMAGGVVVSSGVLTQVIAVDSISSMNNKGNISNLTILSSLVLNNSGVLQFLTLGGMAANATGFGVTFMDIKFDSGCQIRNTIIGGKRVDKLSFSNTQTNKCLFGYSRGQYLKISDSIMFLTAFKHAGDFLTNNLSIDTSGTNNSKGLFGFLYEDMPNLEGKYIYNSEEGHLVYRKANVIELENEGDSLSSSIELFTKSK